MTYVNATSMAPAIINNKRPRPTYLIIDPVSREEEKMSKRVYFDEEECIGCGSCEEVCPDVFKLNDEMEKAEVILTEGGPEDLIEEAMEMCPVECIHWEE